MLTKFLVVVFDFISNADVKNSLVFGKDMNTWLIYVLIFFGLTCFGFAWVWFAGVITEQKAGKSIKQPWE